MGDSYLLSLSGRDLIGAGHSPKILEIGKLSLFSGLAAYTLLNAPDWSVIEVRLRVDVGLFLIVLISMALGRPFTLQYARGVSPEVWNTRAFMRTNYIITAVWAATFAVIVLAEFAILYIDDLPQRVGVIVIVLALV